MSQAASWIAAASDPIHSAALLGFFPPSLPSAHPVAAYMPTPVLCLEPSGGKQQLSIEELGTQGH